MSKVDSLGSEASNGKNLFFQLIFARRISNMELPKFESLTDERISRNCWFCGEAFLIFKFTVKYQILVRKN